MDHAFVYILESARNGRYYIGHTKDMVQRLATHNAGRVKAARHLRPWHLLYTEEWPDATAARKREAHLKRLKSRRALEALIETVS